ncbi:MAG: phosphatidate cytidylyltransferase [bacterium]
MLTRNLLLRIRTGVPLAVLAILYIYLAPELLFILVAVVIIITSVWEYAQAMIHKSIPLKPANLYFLSLLFFLSFLLFWKNYTDLGLICFSLTLLMILFFSFFRQSPGSRLLLWYSLPQAWIVFPVILLILLRFSESTVSGSSLILFIIVVAAFNDIFAYFGGKRFGKHLLAPIISPKKTIEGSIFGLGGGITAGLVFKQLFLPAFISGWRLVLLIVVITAASQLGDLSESKLKRFCGIKDSSNLLPGHGGLLDRIDAYLFAIPVFIGMSYLLDFRLN